MEAMLIKVEFEWYSLLNYKVNMLPLDFYVVYLVISVNY